jgi:hypothetical protein
MRFVHATRLALACAGLAACNTITGIDDFQFGTTTGSGAGGAGGSTTVSTTTTGGGAGGEPICDLNTEYECNETCVSLTDPAFGCGVACKACDVDGMCCPGQIGCTDVGADPLRCGSCSNECGAAEWCENAMCACRPGLTGSAGACTDPKADPSACGGGAACGAPTPFCEGGACVAACANGLTECSGGCVDTNTHPQHCGACGGACAVDELCVGGQCFGYRGTGVCTACPCVEAPCTGDFDKCCAFPGSQKPVCVNHDAPGCP